MLSSVETALTKMLSSVKITLTKMLTAMCASIPIVNAPLPAVWCEASILMSLDLDLIVRKMRDYKNRGNTMRLTLDKMDWNNIIRRNLQRIF